MKTLYLHVGFSKTATSSFQETCIQNQKALLQQGYLYPIFTVNNAQVQNHDLPAHNTALLNIFCKDTTNIYSNKLFGITSSADTKNYFKTKLTHALSTDKDVILSAENISVDMTESEITEMVNLIEGFGFQIKPFALLRAPYGFHCASMQQAIKLGTFGGDITSFISQIENIKKFKSVFNSKIIFFPFSAACASKKGAVHFLFDYIGVNSDAFEIKTVNEGVSNTFVRSQRLLNKHNPIIKDGVLNPDHIDLDIDLGQGKFLLTKQEFEKINTNYETECSFFINTLGSEFVKEEINFVSEPTIAEAFKACPRILENQLSLHAYSKILQIAQIIEETNLNEAIELMQIANKIRPHDLIKLKLSEYEQKLAKQKS